MNEEGLDGTPAADKNKDVPDWEATSEITNASLLLMLTASRLSEKSF